MKGGDAGAALLDGGGLVREAFAQGGGEHRDGLRGVGGDGHGDGEEPLVVGDPVLALLIEERYVDDLRAGGSGEREGAALADGRAERHAEAGDVEREHDVGLGEGALADGGEVEGVRVGEAEAALGVDDGAGERLGELDGGGERGGVASDLADDHHGPRRVGEECGGLVEGGGVRRRRRGRTEERDVGHGERLGHALLLDVGVEADVDGALGVGHGRPHRAEEGFGGSLDAGGLVVVLHVVADGESLHEGGVDPVGGAAVVGVLRASASEVEDGGAVAPRVEDGHRGVLESDDVVESGGHGLAGDAEVAVGDGDGDLLVGAEHHLGAAVAEVHEGVVEPAVAGAGVEGDVLHAERAEGLDHVVGAVHGLAGGASAQRGVLGGGHRCSLGGDGGDCSGARQACATGA